MNLELVGLSITAFFTLCIYSFLYNDNPFYKLAEHVFAGLSAGYYVSLVWHSIIKQQLITPFLEGHQYILIIPGVLGVLMFSRFFLKISWLSRIPMAFVVGNTAGIFFVQQLHGIVMPQVRSTFVSFSSVSGLIMILGVVSTLIFFYFSREHKGILGTTAQIGIWFVMVAFGASFGYTVMARVSLLIGRAQFLLFDWLARIF